MANLQQAISTQRELTERAQEPLDVPGVDIVMWGDDLPLQAALLDEATMTLMAALHRRFWTKRRSLLHGTTGHEADVTRSWTDRLSGLVDYCLGNRTKCTPRGWVETEAAVLIDGCAVPGVIFDLAVVISHSREELRSGASPVVLDFTARDPREARLNQELLNLALDRVGAERGTIPIVSEQCAVGA